MPTLPAECRRTAAGACGRQNAGGARPELPAAPWLRQVAQGLARAFEIAFIRGELGAFAATSSGLAFSTNCGLLNLRRAVRLPTRAWRLDARSARAARRDRPRVDRARGGIAAAEPSPAAGDESVCDVHARAAACRHDVERPRRRTQTDPVGRLELEFGVGVRGCVRPKSCNAVVKCGGWRERRNLGGIRPRRGHDRLRRRAAAFARSLRSQTVRADAASVPAR